MRCPAIEVYREPTVSKIQDLCDNLGYRETFEVIVGATPEGYDFESMLEVWVEICAFINKAYMAAINSRADT